MTALGDVCTNKEIVPNAGIKMIQAVTPATAIGGTDTVTVDLGDFGCTNIHAILGFEETTAGQVVVTQAPTTAVASGVLTITIGGSATTVHTFIIFAY